MFKSFTNIFPLGVWRDTYPTRRDETWDWVHENETRFLDFFFFFILNDEIYRGKMVLFNWKTQNAK